MVLFGATAPKVRGFFFRFNEVRIEEILMFFYSLYSFFIVDRYSLFIPYRYKSTNPSLGMEYVSRIILEKYLHNNK